MKMRQKGVSTAVITISVVIVAVVVVGVVAVVLLGGGLGAGTGTTGIAAMPGSTPRSGIGDSSCSNFLSAISGAQVSEAALAGISMDAYSTGSSTTEVVNHYKGKWSGEGYTENLCMTYDLSQIPYASQYGLSGTMGLAIYQKADQLVGVFAMTYQNETHYVLMAASESAIEALIEAYGGGGGTGGGGTGGEPPTSDVSGSDISDIPRYTGSVRTYYGVLYEGTIIYYVTSASTSTVADFYATQLPANGWTVSGTTTITATKGSAFAYIEIKASSTYSGYTEIQLAYYSM